ncbi:MAG: hypothetical protein QXI55_00910 [Thermofilum sp.]
MPPWPTPLTSDYARVAEEWLNRTDLLGWVWDWWGRQLGSIHLLVTAFILLTAYAGYLHSKSALGAGLVLLLWAPLIFFESVRVLGAVALGFGLASLFLWLFFGK